MLPYITAYVYSTVDETALTDNNTYSGDYCFDIEKNMVE
jgi:hypothetical protein